VGYGDYHDDNRYRKNVLAWRLFSQNAQQTAPTSGGMETTHLFMCHSHNVGIALWM
jgi:hypothetical protein